MARPTFDPPAPPPPHLRPPPMDHSVGGEKPSQYSERMAGIILARAEAGETLTEITADPSMPSRRTLYDWLEDHPGFGAAWLLMRRDQARARQLAAGVKRARRLAAMKHEPRRRSGRRTTYTPQRARAVCKLIRQGLGVRDIARRPGMPSLGTVFRWLQHHPDFQPLYVEACKARDFGLWVDLTLLADEVNIVNFPQIKRRAAVVEKRRADHTPRVWRWE